MSLTTTYNATRTFTGLGTRVLSIDAGTGSIAVQVEHGADNWITMKTYDADAAELIEFLNRKYRFVVTGDATYAL